MHKKSIIQNLFLFCLISATTSYSMEKETDPLALEKEIEAFLVEQMMDDQFGQTMDQFNKLVNELPQRSENKQINSETEQKKPN